LEVPERGSYLRRDRMVHGYAQLALYHVRRQEKTRNRI
jgi:hypothetical protein